MMLQRSSQCLRDDAPRRENAGTSSYTVTEGHPLDNIALKHKMSVETLKSQNSLTINTILPGQVLVVKSTGDDQLAPLEEQNLRVHCRRDARVELGNKSDYIVSYWVVQEDKMKSKAVEKRVLHTMEGSLNASSVGILEGASAGAGAAAKREKETTTEEARAPYFLLSDCRLNARPNDYKQRVAFPRDCTDLRVYAYFQRKEDRRWDIYKDQVCSIGTGHSACILDATNDGIEPYL